MSTMNDLAAQRERLTERLARIDTERAKVAEQLAELEAAERVLSRLSSIRPATGRRTGRPRKAKTAKPARPSATHPNAARGVRKPGAPKLLLGDATLRAVKALGKKATAEQIRGYLGKKFGMQVQPHHLGRALQRHRLGGRLTQRDERWSMSRTANGASAAAE
jgi:transposase